MQCAACDTPLDEGDIREMIYGLNRLGIPDPSQSEKVCKTCQEWFILIVAWQPGKREVRWDDWETMTHGKMSIVQ